MGFMGVWRILRFLGLLIVLLVVDSGGVDGKYDVLLKFVFSMIDGLLLVGCGEVVGVMIEGLLL